MKYFLRSAAFFLIVSPYFIAVCNGQPSLKPFIGLWVQPSDADLVCPIPLAIDEGNIFELPGLHQGDTIPDFKLYTLASDSVHLSKLLQDGKPVLLVDGSYTCPKFRNHLDELNDLQAIYGTKVNIFVIYTVEAHPADPDISPYKGEVWELNSNINLGIIYHQPTTYQERKQVVSDMLDELDIDVPVLIDGPCNEWWESFALAPNAAFLISPDGIVFKKQGWFDNGLYAVSSAIDSLLQNTTTGIEEKENGFQIINDPSSSSILFVFSEALKNFELKLLDASGRIVAVKSGLDTNTFSLEKDLYPPGIYLFSIVAGNKQFNGKVILLH